MRKTILLITMLCAGLVARAQLTFENSRPVISLGGRSVIEAPAEGLWSVATGWQQDWMCGWVHANPTEQEQSGEWTILKGSMQFEQGELLLRDSYRKVSDNLVQCVRRYEWRGEETLSHVTLSVRLQMRGQRMMPCLPGILYYGNKNGAKVDPTRIPVYEGRKGEFAIFEEHRYPMPFAMLENAAEGYVSFKDEDIAKAIIVGRYGGGKTCRASADDHKLFFDLFHPLFLTSWCNPRSFLSLRQTW
jgi:hypothetical protein